MKVCRKCYNKGSHWSPCSEKEIKINQKKYGWCKPEPVEEHVTYKAFGDDKSILNPVTDDGLVLKSVFHPLD